MPRSLRPLVAVIVMTSLATLPAAAAAPTLLFDGKTFAGWNGDTKDTWRLPRWGEQCEKARDRCQPHVEVHGPGHE